MGQKVSTWLLTEICLAELYIGCFRCKPEGFFFFATCHHVSQWQTTKSVSPMCSSPSHSAGQCTRSKAFDKSRLAIQIGTFALEGLSKTKRVVTKCSSHACHPKNYVVLLADGFQVEFPPVPKSCKQKVCKTVVWLQSGGILKEP